VSESVRGDAGQTSSIRTVATASLVGTSIEWYDFFAFAAASALVFNRIFFPNFSEAAGTLAAFATFGVAFFARPFGGVLFGHFGDRVGRKSMLITTLLLMGFSTFCVGLLPTYASIGILAPILLVVLRLLQGLSVGGEWGGAILMSTEHASDDNRNFYGSFPQLGSPVGSILSSSMFILVGLLPDEQFFAWGWRVPFLLSAILIVVGLYVRLKIEESPAFSQMKETQSESRIPILDVLRDHPVASVLGVGVVFYSIGGFYLTNTYALSYATGQLDVGRSVMLIGVFIASVVQIFGTIASGKLADRFGRRGMALGSALAVSLLPFPFFLLINTQVTALIWIAYALVGFFGGALYALVGVLLAGLYATRLRYSGISFGYQVGGMVSGALAPAAAAVLVAAAGGSYWPAAALLNTYALISLICIYLVSATRFQQGTYDNRTYDRDTVEGRA
jgi:MFS family permease